MKNALLKQLRFLKSLSLIAFLASTFLFSLTANAQELIQDIQTITKARVVEVLEQDTQILPGLNIENAYQHIRVQILEGEKKGREVVFYNDYILLEEGDMFYLRHTVNSFEEKDYYSVFAPYRLSYLYFFIGLFVFFVLVFGGIQGLRGLVALLGSFFFIFLLLFPGILSGYSPILVSIGVSSLIIILGSYVTHGFNRTTTSAVLGMVVAIIVTGALAYFAVHATKLSGFSSEEAVYLNFNTQGTIDFTGLLLGGILIGLLGVLYDAAIGQAIAVEELYRVGTRVSHVFIFKRALRIGREHIGALVNTLAIAYVGASLPLLLFFYSSASSISVSMNQEIFATEIIRTMVGGIGLVLAVPATTLIAVFMLAKKHHKKE